MALRIVQGTTGNVGNQATSLADVMVLGHIMTAMPAIDAIPAVVAALPGIVSHADLRLSLPRGLVPWSRA